MIMIMIMPSHDRLALRLWVAGLLGIDERRFDKSGNRLLFGNDTHEALNKLPA